VRRLMLLIVLSFAAPAVAWELRTDSEGDVVRWTKPVVLTLSSTAAEQLKERDATAAVAAAVQHLDEATPFLDVSLQVGDAKPIGYVVGATDNTNSIVVLDTWPYAEGMLAVTLVTLNARTNEILDADVAFNAEHRAFKVLTDGALPADLTRFDDVQNTITHELGHALGLQHSEVAEDIVMYPSSPPGETRKRDLKQDDRDGLLSLYGVAPVTAPPGPTTGGRPAFGCSASASGSSLATLAVLGVLVFLRGRRAATAVAPFAPPFEALAQDARRSSCLGSSPGRRARPDRSLTGPRADSRSVRPSARG
jgi:hypothetical protein